MPIRNPETHYLQQAATYKPPKLREGSTEWKSPSNIAIVKYWGKHGKQLPQNPSISLTLSEAYTRTAVSYRVKTTRGLHVDFLFDDRPYPLFAEKIYSFLNQILPFFPFLDWLDIGISSNNSFPHSSGIASSASSMSALVLCLLDIEQQLYGVSKADPAWLQRASFFSRLASGSASRSLFPYAALWGHTPYHDSSSNYFAVGLENRLHPVFKTLRDSILIISSETKTVSSRAGHSLMEKNPYALIRYQTASETIKELLGVLHTGDIEHFIDITESEALQLHALMMSSKPPFILMEPNTLQLIKLVRQFRAQSGIPICFTLDAGPNLHLLYPELYQDKVKQFIDNQLKEFCQAGAWIDDYVGDGPVKL